MYFLIQSISSNSAYSLKSNNPQVTQIRDPQIQSSSKSKHPPACLGAHLSRRSTGRLVSLYISPRRCDTCILVSPKSTERALAERNQLFSRARSNRRIRPPKKRRQHTHSDRSADSAIPSHLPDSNPRALRINSSSSPFLSSQTYLGSLRLSPVLTSPYNNLISPRRMHHRSWQSYTQYERRLKDNSCRV